MIDVPVSAWFQANTHPVITQFMLMITHWHSTPGTMLMTAVLALWLARRGMVGWLVSLALSVPGGMLLNVGVKHLVQRERPHFDDPLVTLTTYSFPSGHTAGATLLYGFLAVLLLAHARAAPWRVAIVPVAVLMVLLVGMSRIYLGAHYLTDVLAALVEGLLWLALILGGLRSLRRRRLGELAQI